MTDLTADLPDAGLFAGRVWRPELEGPALVTVRTGRVLDVTTPAASTMRDLLELPDPAAHLQNVDGEDLGSVEDICRASLAAAEASDCAAHRHLLAPCDLQAIKACGVTFARSMVERVIEERAAGDPSAAEDIRNRVGETIGSSLSQLIPGSDDAAAAKQALIDEGLWSQYLEVGIGPDAEIFTKCQPMSAVGWGAAVGLHPASRWNNPEPEIALAVASDGRILGATLGNDTNLRDFEGRSALLLTKAKDNNASASLGPFIRLFDAGFPFDGVRRTELAMRIEGADGFVLDATSSMSAISRDPEDLVRQTLGAHHQYPDGLLLYLGTAFAPVEDRDRTGEGFTHHPGDRVRISAPGFGALENRVALSTECPPWRFGIGALMRNLAARHLLATP